MFVIEERAVGRGKLGDKGCDLLIIFGMGLHESCLSRFFQACLCLWGPWCFFALGVEQFLWNEVLRPASGEDRGRLQWPSFFSCLPERHHPMLWEVYGDTMKDTRHWTVTTLHTTSSSPDTDHKLISKAAPLCAVCGVRVVNSREVDSRKKWRQQGRIILTQVLTLLSCIWTCTQQAGRTPRKFIDKTSLLVFETEGQAFQGGLWWPSWLHNPLEQGSHLEWLLGRWMPRRHFQQKRMHTSLRTQPLYSAPAFSNNSSLLRALKTQVLILWGMNCMRNSLIFSKSAKNTHLPPRLFKHALPIPDAVGCQTKPHINGHHEVQAGVNVFSP